MRAESRRARIRRVSAAVFIIAAFLFLAGTAARQFDELATYDWDIAPLGLVGSVLLLIGVLTGGVAIWHRVLRHMGHRIAFGVLVRIWFLSSLGRYIPGKVWQFVGVAELSRACGLPALAGITSLVVYIGFAAVAAGLVGVYLLPSDAARGWAPLLQVIRLAGPVVLLLLHPRVIDFALAALHRLTRRSLGRWDATWLDNVVLVAACCAMWLAFGLAFLLFIGSVAAPGIASFPALTAAFALSFLAGYMAIIAPAGLGVKDGALAVLLAVTMNVPLGVAATLSLAARAWSIAGDALPALVFIRSPRAPRVAPDGESAA